jgi:hypothetical protein
MAFSLTSKKNLVISIAVLLALQRWGLEIVTAGTDLPKK